MIFVNCPHCSVYIEVEKVNCKIFRCGIIKINGKQIDPHLSKEGCDYFVKNNLLYGCGKPFQLVETNKEPTTPNEKPNEESNEDPNEEQQKYIAVICDYI
jgi:hypothetical protein